MHRRTFLHLLAATPAAKLAHAADDDLIIAINQTTLESAALMIQKIPGVLVRPMPAAARLRRSWSRARADAATGNENAGFAEFRFRGRSCGWC